MYTRFNPPGVIKNAEYYCSDNLAKYSERKSDTTAEKYCSIESESIHIEFEITLINVELDITGILSVLNSPENAQLTLNVHENIQFQ